MRKIDLAWIILMLFIIVCMIYIMYTVYSNKEAFFDNPFIYGSNHMRGGGEVECSCYQTKPNGRTSYFGFNKTAWLLGELSVKVP